MSAEFLDTNIFVYLFDKTSPAKSRVAEEQIYRAIEKGAGFTSFQVVQELLNVMTQNLSPPASAEESHRFLGDTMDPVWKIRPSNRLYHSAIDVKARYGYHFYDVLNIAAALEAGCERLYSEGLQPGQKIGPSLIDNPFATA